MMRAPHDPGSQPEGWHIAVLHGGISSEHDISVLSSRGVVQTLRARGHRVTPVWVDRDGAWHLGADDGEVAAAVATPLPFAPALAALVALAPDVCFLGFHGTYGEDGRVQAALELAGLAYTGSGPLASALAMDKVVARRLFVGVGLPVPAALEIDASAVAEAGGRAAVAAEVVARVGVPCVVKVAAGGSSVGVEIVRSADAVDAALARVGLLWPRLLAEAFVAGVELTGGVLEDDAGPVALPAVEIAPRAGRFFDYEVKYDPSLVDEIVPARVAPEIEAELRRVALAAHEALGCVGVSRSDAIVDAAGKVWLLETNTLPGLTPASLLPKAAAAAGRDYGALLDGIVRAALRRRGVGL